MKTSILSASKIVVKQVLDLLQMPETTERELTKTEKAELPAVLRKTFEKIMMNYEEDDTDFDGVGHA